MVRIKQSGKISNYVAYAEGQLKEESGGRVELVAKGKGIEKAISVAEILKRNDKNLHQQSTLRSEGEGVGRPTPCLKIVLAIHTDCLDTSAPGYAPPQA